MAHAHELVLSIPYVAASLEKLRRLPVHQTFPGYLSVKRGLVRSGRKTVGPDCFKSFYTDYMEAPGGPPRKPYLLIFNGGGRPTTQNAWFNENVAGSYAPSSFRGVSPLRRVITITGEGTTATYALKADHARAAKEHLATGRKIDIVSLAATLYRNYAFDEKTESMREVVARFRADFGFLETNTEQSAAFDELFSADDDALSVAPFEPLEK